MIAAISFKVTEDYGILIYSAGSYSDIDWDMEGTCILGENYKVYPYKSDAPVRDVILITEGLDEKPVLRFVETKRYVLKVKSAENQFDLPHFQNEGNKLLKCEKDSNSMIFQFVNYLGRTRLYFPENTGTEALSFEVVPDKMHYEEDYVALTEDLAEQCTELLLDFSGATSNVFSQRKDGSDNVFEQFIFLRKFCYTGNLQSLFEAIKRNPDRILLCEESFKPFGQGLPSKKFYSNPFIHGKKWQSTGERFKRQLSAFPLEISVTKKIDSYDTIANRFIKYALKSFDDVCEGIIRTVEKEKTAYQVQCAMEAESMHNMISDILRDRFFEEINELQMMPFNNQILQKREGYTQIFSAYSMMDLALQLDWKGQDNIYEGESKNVAQLYEYWLYFELYKIIKSIAGCKCTGKDNSIAFVSENNGLIISLQQGRASCQYFEIEDYLTKINLYYNRTFSYKDFQSSKYAGSYSRDFRPDYTLAVFPSFFFGGELNGERKATDAGAVRYIHFDAKYRVSDITSIIGNRNNSGHENSYEDTAVEVEKTEAIVNTYQRGDLLKMHTYNDAIRRTAGSYVLYPGSDNYDSNDSTSFRMYDEIIPGVGAFAVKPGIAKMGEAVLRDFIVSVIEVNSRQQSRMNRMNYFSGMVLNEPATQYAVTDYHYNTRLKNNTLVSKIKEQCVAGYIRPVYYRALKLNGMFETEKQFLFYFYAIKDNAVYTHHKDIFTTKYFRFYTNNINKDGYYLLQKYKCRITANELLSREDLVQRLKKQGYDTSVTSHHADFYYVITLQVLTDDLPEEKLTISQVSSQNGNDSFSPHSPKVLAI